MQRRGPRIRVVVVMVVALGAAIVTAAPAGRTVLAADPTDTQVAEAIQFRETFGLRSGEDYVRRSFNDETFSSSDWNVPLDDDEVADLARRTEIRDSLPPAIRYLSEQFGPGGFLHGPARPWAARVPVHP